MRASTQKRGPTLYYGAYELRYVVQRPSDPSRAGQSWVNHHTFDAGTDKTAIEMAKEHIERLKEFFPSDWIQEAALFKKIHEVDFGDEGA